MIICQNHEKEDCEECHPPMGIVNIMPYLCHKTTCAMEIDKNNADTLGYTMKEYTENYGSQGCSCGLQQLLFDVGESRQ